MRTTDKGLQKAIKRQPHYELPSNFSYRMMQKIQEESILREKRQEKGCSSSSLSSPYSAGEVASDFLYGNTEQPSSAIGTPVRKYFRTPIRSFSTCPRSVPSVCCTSSTDGYERKCIKQFKDYTILKRANLIRNSPFPFLYQSEILFPIAFQFFCLELTDEVEMLFYFRFSVVHIHVQ